MNGNITTLIFDLDDTLILTRDHYRESFESFVDLMEKLDFERSEVTPVFDSFEMKNNASMGVSPARYPTSMKMTYEELCRDRGIEPDMRITEDVEDAGWKISRARYSSMPGARDVVERLSEKFRLILLTRGEEKLQMRKVRESGMENYFSKTYIVPQKNVEAFRRILALENLDPGKTAVIGDSIPADINPSLKLGMTAVYIPYQLSGYSWPYEDNVRPENDKFITLVKLTDLVPLLLPGRKTRQD